MQGAFVWDRHRETDAFVFDDAFVAAVLVVALPGLGTELQLRAAADAEVAFNYAGAPRSAVPRVPAGEASRAGFFEA